MEKEEEEEEEEREERGNGREGERKKKDGSFFRLCRLLRRKGGKMLTCEEDVALMSDRPFFRPLDAPQHWSTERSQDSVSHNVKAGG